MVVASFSKYAAVLLELAIDKALDYGIPEQFLDQVKPGVHVEVPVRGHLRKGYILQVKESPSYPRVQAIHRVCSTGELVTDDLFQLAIWMSKYYCAPLQEVFQIMLPASLRKEVKHKEQLYVMRRKTREELAALCQEIRSASPAQARILEAMLQVKKGILLSELLEQSQSSRASVESLAKKGWLAVDIIRIDRSPFVDEEYFPTKPKKLNPSQQAALDKILGSVAAERYETHLLYGITGSGKTEVYLQAIANILERGKGVIMLVPEVALTVQMIERFRSRFEGKIAVLHHRLSDGERFDEWHRIRSGAAPIVIGPRSAVFSPVPKLGMIIVDEEHEQSYKQQDSTPCYHARDVAVMRATRSQAVVILGSATPSLESYTNATKGKYTLSTLSVRADAAVLPQVTIVNMAREYEKAKGFTSFSQPLLDGIEKRYQRGEQTILFLNRRGYHTTLLCPVCQHVIKCRDCDISLTLHKAENQLGCHLCGFTIAPPPSLCPQCKSCRPLQYKGVGTELVEKSLLAIFPSLRTLRIDADTTKHKGSHQQLLRAFGSGKADVLVGTQMITKGLHFPEVTLVGVLNSDGSLNIPDFRSSETTFQLITQVAGRAGRGAMQGEVIIQTCLPDNSTIRYASQQDYDAFYHEEIVSRQLFSYPPFSSMVKLSLTGPHEMATKQAAEQLRHALTGKLSDKFELHPVLAAGYAKVKGKFRYQFLVRGPAIPPINEAILRAKQEVVLPAAIKLFIDVNPLSTYF